MGGDAVPGNLLTPDPEAIKAEQRRCWVRLCIHNKPDACEKPVEVPCPRLWYVTGNKKAGVGVDLARRWD